VGPACLTVSRAIYSKGIRHRPWARAPAAFLEKADSARHAHTDARLQGGRSEHPAHAWTDRDHDASATATACGAVRLDAQDNNAAAWNSMRDLQFAGELGGRVLPPGASKAQLLAVSFGGMVAAVVGVVKLVVRLSPGSEAAAAGPPLPPVGATGWWCVAAGLVLPVLLFGAVDQATHGTALATKLWGRLGELIVEPDSSTCEPARPGRFLVRPYNAHSSNAQIAAGCFIIGQTLSAQRPAAPRAPWACALLAVTLVVLGLTSYMWWGARRALALRADRLMMEAHCYALMVLFLSIAHPAVRTPSHGPQDR
jgi:hypothetical protein